MKIFIIFLAGAMVLGAALPASAGPDWHIIEQGRTAKLTQMHYENERQAAFSSSGSSSIHEGNGANQDQMIRTCTDMMKKPA